MQPQYPPAYPQQYPQPVQQPPMPQYPPQQPAYAPPMPYAPQPYPQQYAAPVPVGPPPVPGTLDGFYEQPSTGGGPSWKFNGKPIGTSYAGFVARAVVDSDVRHQTNQAGVPQTYKDGRPKLVMVVPMQVQPTQEYPEGVAGWWVKGQARDELARAMAEAGAPTGPPEPGAFIRVTLVGQRPVPNMNPAYQYRVEYVRPGQAAMPAEVAPTFAQAAAQPAPVTPQQPHYATPPLVPSPQPQYAPPVPVMQAPPQPVQQVPAPVAPQPVGTPVPAAQPAQMPTGLSAEQQALFATLTGQQAAPTA